MQKLITINELNNICNYLIIRASSHSIYMYEVLLFLQETGARISEVTTKNNLIFQPANIVTILPKKKSEIRNITLKNTYTFLPNYHSQTNTEIQIIADSTIKQFIKREIFSYAGLSITENIASKIFRYNYAQTLLHNGYNVNTIQQYLGHKEIKNTHEYLKPLYWQLS